MDRFIEELKIMDREKELYLKSSMDRFIVDKIYPPTVLLNI